MDTTSLRTRLTGPPPTLPRWLDTASEWWWARTPRTRAVLLLAAVAAVAALLGAASDRDPWGPPVTVVTAARDLPAGHRLADGDLRQETRPADLTPERPLAADATGVLTTAMPAGSVLAEGHVGEGGIGALVDDGRAGVAVTAELLPEDTPGARLDLVAPDGAGGARLVARDARVLARRDAQVWLEVDAAAAADVAAQARAGALAVAVRPH